MVLNIRSNSLTNSMCCYTHTHTNAISVAVSNMNNDNNNAPRLLRLVVVTSCSLEKSDLLFLYTPKASMGRVAFDLATDRDFAKNTTPRNGVLLPGVTVFKGTGLRDALLSAGGADVCLAMTVVIDGCAWMLTLVVASIRESDLVALVLPIARTVPTLPCTTTSIGFQQQQQQQQRQ
jgi:hypothetical protein